MQIGVDQHSFHHVADLSGIAMLQRAQAFGLEGVQFENFRQISPSFDPGEARSVREYACEHGLYLEGGIPCLNPHRPGPVAVRDGDGDFGAGLRRHLAALSETVVGSRAIRCFIGGPGDRLHGRASWPQQVADSVAVVNELAPLLRDLDLRLAFENHADASIDELIRVIETVGNDIAGICLDTGNLVITLDDPLGAGKRAAPYTIATQIKDGVVTFDAEGLVYNPRPCGEGVVPLAEILAEVVRCHPEVKLSIEDHGRLFPIPIFQDEYLETFERLLPVELVHIVRLARECETRIAAGALAGPDQVEAIPWTEQADDRLHRGARYLKQLLNGGEPRVN